MNKKGDILRGKNTNHPIVYLSDRDEYYFIGCILTHSNTNDYKNNIALLPEHFETHDVNNSKYEVKYDDSYFVNLNLIKKAEWGPFNKVGKLANAGIEFLENHLRQSDLIEWRTYISKSK